jgi:hypothetical protein
MNLPEGWPTDEMVDKAVIVLRDRAYIPLEDGRRLANLMIRAAFAAAPTPPAQEDEPVGFRWRKKTTPDRWHLCRIELLDDAEEGNVETELLYTRPDDRLRKAAESLVALSDRWGTQMPYGIKVGIEELRAALEGK